jgi:hypothetical protein
MRRIDGWISQVRRVGKTWCVGFAGRVGVHHTVEGVVGGESDADNAIKAWGMFSEEDAHDALMACLKRKSLPGLGLLTLSSFLRPDGVRTSAVCDCLVAQSLVVQLIDLGFEGDCHYTGRVLR